MTALFKMISPLVFILFVCLSFQTSLLQLQILWNVSLNFVEGFLDATKAVINKCYCNIFLIIVMSLLSGWNYYCNFTLKNLFLAPPATGKVWAATPSLTV